MPTAFITNYLGNLWLTNKLSGDGFWMCLFTDDPTLAGNMTLEVLGSGYERQPATLSLPSGKTVTTTNTQTFSGMPGVTIKYIGITGSKHGSDLLAYLELDSPITVAAGHDFAGAPGDWAFSL